MSSSPAPIVTPRMHLVPADVALLSGLIAGGEFQVRTGWQVIDGFLEFPGALEFSLKAVMDNPGDAEWWMPRLFIHQTDRALIGVGGYKGPADAAGYVEIGYNVAPGYRGGGYATEAAQGLVNHALSRPGVCAVCAHTLAEVNASNAVLAKIGFARTAEIEDADEGTIWRWEYLP